MSDLLAIIPARGGSKRIPGKNTRELGGLPLIGHTLRTAHAAGCFARILVSTDDPAIADIARAHGGEVPWLRSAAHADDTSNVVDAVLEVLDCIDSDGDPLPDAIMLLQPTSPFRSVDSILRAVRLFDEAGGESIVSVSPARSHPWWCKRLSSGGELVSFVSGIDDNLRSQDLPPAYVLNGLVYLSSVDNLRARGTFHSAHTRALVIESPEESLDIDTPFDWLVAETVYRARKEATA